MVLIVVHQNRNENQITRLRCRSLMPLDGYPFDRKIIPIGGYVYDGVQDCYLINCIDHLALGHVPFSYKLEMDETGLWSSFVPIPHSILKQWLEVDKKLTLEKFECEYSEYKEQVYFQYIQFTSISQC